MPSIPVRSARNGYVLIMLLLLAVVATPLLIPGTAETVFARKYGGYKKNYGAIYAKYIARCKAGCGRTNGAIAACIKRDENLQASNCRQVFNADRGLCTGKSCVTDAKSRLKLCMQGIGAGIRHDRKAITGHNGVKRCGGCCQRTKGQGDCLSYFSSSRFYGSYRYHGHLTCNGSYGTSDGTTGDCDRQCQRVAARARAACGPVKKADPACLQQVAAAMQACVARCRTPGSPSGAFLGDLSARIRSHVASWLPWLVRGWND